MTVTAPETTRADRLPAVETGARPHALSLAERLIALARAETHRSPLARDEDAPALVAGVGAAGQAVALSCLGEEPLTAAPAVSEQAAVGEASSRRPDQLGIFAPERVVGFGVAGTAERDEVAQRVRRLVVAKEAERSQVVDGDVLGSSALGASSPVSSERPTTLALPAWASRVTHLHNVQSTRANG